MKKRVLVFPCGSEVGLEIKRSLYGSTHFELFGGSSIDDHGRFAYKNYIGDLPFVDDPKFIDKLNEVISKNKIDFIYPAHDSVVLALAKEEADGHLGCRLVGSRLSTCEVARSKTKTYEYFKDLLRVPMIYDTNDEIAQNSFPLFLKPDVGQGSKGIHKALNQADIEFYLKKDPTLICLEYLPGREYTVDCFTNKEGHLKFSAGRERSRILNGISVKSKYVKNPKFKEIAETINANLSFRGAWFFQVKEDKDGELTLMEVAPRIAGTMGLTRAKGINLPLLSLFDVMGFETSIIENTYDIIVDRALCNSYQVSIEYEDVYLDFDDLIIINQEINTTVIMFIFQCINKGRKIHLITKHAEDLQDTLKRYRLQGLFDEIIHLKPTDKKSNYIHEKKAIFIDDSYSERKEVYEKKGIPVFDTHAVESLVEHYS